MSFVLFIFEKWWTFPFFPFVTKFCQRRFCTPFLGIAKIIKRITWIKDLPHLPHDVCGVCGMCGVCGVCGIHQVRAASCSACTNFYNTACMQITSFTHTLKHVPPVFLRLRWRVPLCYHTSHDHVDPSSSWLAITSIQLLAGKSLINYWFPLMGDWWLTHWAANSARDLQRASCPLFWSWTFWVFESMKRQNGFSVESGVGCRSLVFGWKQELTFCHVQHPRRRLSHWTFDKAQASSFDVSAP